MDTLINDIRYCVRNLLKRPGFTLIAIVTLAIGIGANTAVFSIVNALLFRPRPVAEPERLFEIYAGDEANPYGTNSYPDFSVYREQNEVLSGLAAYHVGQFKLGGAETVEQIFGEVVSGNYFDLLGVKPIRGRTFLLEEDQTPGTHPVAVISHALWQRRFAADPAIVGRPITLNNQSLTVVGIAPPHYTGMIRGLGIDVWVPTMMMPQLTPDPGVEMLNSRANSWLFIVGRLKPGSTLEQARARFELISRQLKQLYPDDWLTENASGKRDKFVTVLPESETRIHPQLYSSAYAAIALVLVMINLVLLIACLNLAGLLLARAFERRHEMGVRIALGAGRVRIVRQLLTESVLLALVAGAAGTLLAVWLTNLLIALLPALPEGIRLSIDLTIDWRVLVCTFGFSFLVGVFFGLVPALQASRRDVVEGLNRSSAVLSNGYARSRLRNALILAQVAFSLVLLVGAGLAMRSLRNISPTKIGFDSANVVVAPLGLDQKYDRTRSRQFYHEVEQQTRALPGVSTVNFIDDIPGGLLGGIFRSVEIEGYQPASGEKMEIGYNTISAGYLSTMNIPVVQGREFTEYDREGAPCVAVINETFQRRYFADHRALGKRLLTKAGLKGEKQSCEIVGVVRDNKVQSLQKNLTPWYAFPFEQSAPSRVMMLVHSSVAPETLVPQVRRIINSLDRNIAVSDVVTLNDTFKPFLYIYQVFATVIGGCGILAILLACLGIYGTIAYGVRQRTHEIGIRMALGATAHHVLHLVVRQGMVWVLGGFFSGLLLALVLTRVLTSSIFDVDLLYGVSATDLVTYSIVCAFVFVTTLLACYLPARRATKVNPLEALRYE